MYVDSHCHLSYPELSDRLAEIRADMQTGGVGRALCICTTLEEFDRVHALALAHDNFWASVGVHPDNEGVQEPTLDDLLRRASLPRVVALGETGLDYYRLNGRSQAEMEWQRERFRVHIRAARRTGLPLVIHTRSASRDTLDVLSAEGERDVGGVFHCFTETMDVARAALDLGFYISFSGILTFKNAKDLREVARFVPLDRCLIETDSPYLAPAPFRGKTNTPALLPWVAKQLAELKGLSVEEIGRITSANFEYLFRIPPVACDENS
ncbi:MAG: DNAase [Burkholderiales bacterium PBB1]|nr:MAG: DNAase [Burkholderiales bacterium PBB1]